MQMKPQYFYISTSCTTDAKASKSTLVKSSGYEKQRNSDASVHADGRKLIPFVILKRTFHKKKFLLRSYFN
jgi:hypothetical protein